MLVDGISAEQAITDIEGFVRSGAGWQAYEADLDYDPFEALRFVFERMSGTLRELAAPELLEALLNAQRISLKGISYCAQPGLDSAEALRSRQPSAPTSEGEIERLREALEPFAALEVPSKPQGNAGAYSIRHSDITRARAALTRQETDNAS